MCDMMIELSFTSRALALKPVANSNSVLTTSWSVIAYPFFLITNEYCQLFASRSSSYVQPEDGKFRLAFVLQHSNSDSSERLDGLGSSCFHELKQKQNNVNPETLAIISLRSESSWDHLEFSKTITEPGYYHLYFSNCEPTTRSDFHLTITQYNVEPMGNGVVAINYLSAGETSLPFWYFFITVAFGFQLFVFVSYSIRNRLDPCFFLDRCSLPHWAY